MPKRSNKIPESNLPVELVIRTGRVEITAKGTIKQLAKEAGSLRDFANLLAGGVSEPEPDSEESSPLEVIGVGQMPVIKVSNSTKDNILALFSTTWGRSPRNIEEVSSALSTNGVPVSDPQIGTALLRLVKNSDLRRIRKNGQWHYYRIPQ